MINCSNKQILHYINNYNHFIYKKDEDIYICKNTNHKDTFRL